MSLSQTVTSVAVILSAGGSFAFFYIFLHFPMTVGIYLALPFAMPFALAGFLRIHGMSPIIYLRKRRRVTGTGILLRRPAYVVDLQRIRKELKEEKNQMKKTCSGKSSVLQTEDDIFIRSKYFEHIQKEEAYHESKKNNEGI